MSFLRCKKCKSIFPPEKISSYSQLCTTCENHKTNCMAGFLNSKTIFIFLGCLAFIFFYHVAGGALAAFLAFLTLIFIIALNKPVQTELPHHSHLPYQNLHSANRELPQEWARRVIASSNTVILDCETTGLGENDEIIQLAIIDLQGNVLFDSLIKPSPRKRISQAAQATHGITKDRLKNAPSFGDVTKTIFEIISEKSVITYNAEFDRRMLLQTIKKYPEASVGNITQLTAAFDCAMKPYAAYIGEWVDWKQDYKWQKLPGGDHSALGDCRATLEVIKKMAA